MKGNEAIEQLLAAKRSLGNEICAALLERIVKTGFSVADIVVPDFEKVEFSLQKDPYSADQGLIGHWYDSSRQKIGEIQFLGNGTIYAEYDVVKPHPGKPQWFVEAVSAWGQEESIKTEVRLLPSVQ